MTTKTEELIEQIKEVQLRGNTHPKNMGLLDKIIAHLIDQDAWIQRQLERMRRDERPDTDSPA